MNSVSHFFRLDALCAFLAKAANEERGCAFFSFLYAAAYLLLYADGARFTFLGLVRERGGEEVGTWEFTAWME